MKLPKALRCRPRTDLERENAVLKAQLATASLLVWYYSATRRPCDHQPCQCQQPTARRHRWRTSHRPTEALTRRIK